MKRDFLSDILGEVRKACPGWVYAGIVQEIEKAQWTAAYINELPDSAFLFIEEGGEKDADGRTAPRALRHLPYRDQDGKIDLPHLRNALARLSQTKIPGMDETKIRDKASAELERGNEKDDTQKSEVARKQIAFVSSVRSPLELARNEILVGKTGEIFNEKYLAALGVSRDDIHLTSLDSLRSVADAAPLLLVALGKDAATGLDGLADFTLPHPEALRKHGDSGEVARKCKAIKKSLVDNTRGPEYFKDRLARLDCQPIAQGSADSTSSPVTIKKSNDAKRIVYGVVSDPYGEGGAVEDAHNDWISPANVEKMAHDYVKSSREVRLQHASASSAQVVESWIEQYPAEEYHKAMAGEAHQVGRRQFGNDVVHSGSWCLGVELGEGEWKAFQDGQLNAFSIGGIGVRQPLTKDQMPKVTFVDYVGKALDEA